MELAEYKFQPWKGSQYENSGFRGFKLLILGESHYEKMKIADYRGITVKLVEEIRDSESRFLSTEKESRFWVNIMRVIEQKKLEDIDIRAFWESVCLYNYVQDILPSASSAPSPDQWNNSKERFFRILNELKPDRVLCLGRRLWNHLPYDSYSKYCNIRNNEVGLYSIESGSVYIMSIYHPSYRYFKPEIWKDIISEFLKG